MFSGYTGSPVPNQIFIPVHTWALQLHAAPYTNTTMATLWLLYKWTGKYILTRMLTLLYRLGLTHYGLLTPWRHITWSTLVQVIACGMAAPSYYLGSQVANDLFSNYDIITTSSNGNIYRATGPLCGEFTDGRWITRTKASDTELWCVFFYLRLIYGWVNNRKSGDFGRRRAHYIVTVIIWTVCGQEPTVKLDMPLWILIAYLWTWIAFSSYTQSKQ